MSKVQDQDYLVSDQYKNANNLRARIELHERFSTNRADFSRWVFDQMVLPENARVLELGTGPANFWVKNAERISSSLKISLSDLSAGMVEEARQATQAIDATFDYQVLDAQAIDFEDDSFDVVVANHMLYHVPDIDKAISEIRRVLKPGGRFYAATNGADHMKELDEFILEHLAGKVEGAHFDLMRGLAFRLENGQEMLSKQFRSVKITKFDCDLSVTEAKPYLAYILSMARAEDIIKSVSQEQFDMLISGAHKVLEDQLEKGPIHVTKATGLFEAS